MKPLFIRIILCFIHEAYTENSVNGSSVGRILGGQDSAKGEYVYVVRIETLTQNGYFPVCTGAVLSKTTTLTAAHCLKSIKASWYAYVKCFTCSGQRTTATILRNETQAHPHYILLQKNQEYETMLYNDIAIIRHEPMHLSAYGKVSAVYFTALYGEVAFAAGYGISSRVQKKGQGKQSGIFNYDVTQDDQLKVLDVVIVRCDNWLCRGHYPAMLGAPKNIRRAVTATTCNGDSGGPLIHDSGIVGVIVSGRCDLTRHVPAGLYVPTSPYLRWLRDNVANQPV